MDFFILFAAMGLVALARIAVGLAAAPYGAIDWAAVRAQILVSLGAEATASRAQREEATQRRAAKRHRHWARKAAAAEGRAKALSAAKAARQAVRKAAKAAARAKSATVAERYGHAAQRAAAAVRAHRRLVAAGLTTPVATAVGIKARKRAERGSTSAQLAAARATRLAVAQQRNAAARAAADAANAAFTAQRAVKAATQSARTAWVNLRREALGTQQHYVWTAANAKAELAAAKAEARAALAEAKAARQAAREEALAEAKALAAVTWEQSQAARAVLRLERKARAKASLLQWLAAGNGQVSKAAETRVAKLAEEADLACEVFWADTGVAPEVAADRGAVWAARKVVRAARRMRAEVAA